MSDKDLLLWDGTCGFCRRSVDWVRRQPGGDGFEIVPYQEAPTPPMTPEMRAACKRAVHVVTRDGRVLRAGRACLYVWRALGHGFTATLFSLPPLRWLLEIGYWIVARNRHLASKILFRPRHP